MTKEIEPRLTMFDRVIGNFEMDEDTKKAFTDYYNKIHTEAFYKTNEVVESVVELLNRHRSREITKEQFVYEIKKITRALEERLSGSVEIVLPGLIDCVEVKISVEGKDE